MASSGALARWPFWLLCLGSLWSRIHRIDDPRCVVFDETHFGRFAIAYLEGRYFFDLHPPLGKLLFAAIGRFSGLLESNFTFDEIGLAYPDSVPLWQLRALPAVLGAAVVPLAAAVVSELGYAQETAILAGLMVLTDTAMLTQSRLIMLDSILLFFTVLATLAVLKTHRSHRSDDFTPRWWFWLFTTGFALGGAVSTKLVGLAVVMLVGCITVSNMWEIVTDRRVTPRLCMHHLMARAIGLILLPAAVYSGLWSVHFSALPLSGTGDPFMSFEFQAGLKGNPLATTSAAAELPVKTATAGLTISLRQMYGTRCWLHSHRERYPVHPSELHPEIASSAQQQATCYPFGALDDPNNLWRIELPLAPTGAEVRHGAIVVLRHLATGCTLNTHNVAAPVTHTKQEVSCYHDDDDRRPDGQRGQLPRFDRWRLEVLGQRDPAVNIGVTLIRLTHTETGRVLQTSGANLPSWGFLQHEIVGGTDFEDLSGGWFIDDFLRTSSQVDPETKPVAPRSSHPNELGFWAKVYELHAAMILANSKLSADNGHDHAFCSTPLSWLIAPRGVAYWQQAAAEAGGGGRQIYLIGNIVVWWGGAAAVAATVILKMIYVVRKQRRYAGLDPTATARFDRAISVLLLGWAVHYLPFFAAQRQLFLHHYLPSLLFSTMLTACFVEHVLLDLVGSTQLWHATLVGVIATSVGVAITMAPFAYGWRLTPDEIEARRWDARWDFYGFVQLDGDVTRLRVD